MLLRFRFSNFRSFREEQELSLVAGSSLKEPDTLLIHPPNLKESVLPSAAIYGANASGKTNVIRALLFVSGAVLQSHRGWPPDRTVGYEPFLINKESGAESSQFEVDFLLNGVRQCYGFRLNATEILEEWLFVYPKGKKQSWFHRRHGKPISFGAKMPGTNRVIEGLTRKNSLFLSAAAQNNHEALMPTFKWFTELLFVADAMADRSIYLSHTADLCKDSLVGDAVSRLVRAADLGIAGMQVEQLQLSEDTKKKLDAIASVLEIKEIPVTPAKSRIRLLHRVGEGTLPFDEDKESAGTIAYLRVLGPIVIALNKGAVLCVDEIDASLHPLLASQLVRLFNDPSTNSKGAQLIFNTHDATLLGRSNLRRDQIWFAEKSNDGVSHLYPLTDFKPRQNENLESGYLQGRYGAIPFLNPRAFLAEVERSDGKA